MKTLLMAFFLTGCASTTSSDAHPSTGVVYSAVQNALCSHASACGESDSGTYIADCVAGNLSTWGDPSLVSACSEDDLTACTSEINSQACSDATDLFATQNGACTCVESVEK